MGSAGSKTNPPAFEKPWRDTKWGKEQKEIDLNYVKEYHPENENIKNIRILLHGPVGAGKSSFINSVNNVIRGRMTTDALANNSTGSESFTKKYQTHKTHNMNFMFNDIMGVECDKGVLEEDVIFAIKGHVNEGYEFNPVSELSNGDPGYNHFPTSEDKAHVLVYVLSADKVSAGVFPEDFVDKMRKIRLAARDIDIPQMCILTMIDMACDLVKGDIQSVYKSKFLKEKMEEISTRVGIPMNCIFPVKNYHDEIILNDAMDVLILTALRQMIDFGEDFINRM